MESWIKDAISKMFEKIDSVKADQADMKVTLAKNTESLIYHIKRTDKLEEALDILKDQVFQAEEDLTKHGNESKQRSDQLKEYLEEKLSESTNQILSLIKPMSDDWQKQRIKEELKEERRKSIKSTSVTVGIIGAIITIVLNLPRLIELFVNLL